MITLPDPPVLSRGPLRGFWLATCVPLATLTVSGGRRLGGARGAVAAAGAGGAVIAVGLARPGLARRPYRAWAAGSRWVAARLTSYTTCVAHATAVRALPQPPTAFANSGRETAWTSASGQDPASYPSPCANARYAPGLNMPMLTAYRWAVDAQVDRGRWLVACLAVLRWLQPPAESTGGEDLPQDTYTLF